MLNVLSIDYESWVHYSRDVLGGPGDILTPESGRKLDDGYVPWATERLLQALRRHRQRLTFFVVAEIYDWYPECIEAIAADGHEIAWHGHSHERLRDARTLLGELERSERFLARFRPAGFRAPQLYLPQGMHEIIKRHGFRYSSSSYDAPSRQEYGGVREFPVSSVAVSARSPEFPKHLSLRLLRRRLPWGSGLILPILGRGALPLIRAWNRRGWPAIIFVHPWQLYKPAQLTTAGFRLHALRRSPLGVTYQCAIPGLFERLLAGCQFGSFAELLDSEGTA